ncbi:MAG: hypothetical protein ABW168_22875 [Sedimenticola sp.]
MEYRVFFTAGLALAVSGAWAESVPLSRQLDNNRLNIRPPQKNEVIFTPEVPIDLGFNPVLGEKSHPSTGHIDSLINSREQLLKEAIGNDLE